MFNALEKVNAYNFRRRTNARWKQFRRAKKNSEDHDDAVAKLLAPAVKKQRRLFRREFRGPAWKKLSLDLRGEGFFKDYRTGEYLFSFEYAAKLYGMWFYRKFFPRTPEDITAEAWRLAGILVAWGAGTEEKTKGA